MKRVAVLLFVAATVSVAGEPAVVEEKSRIAEIEAERDAKSTRLEPDSPSSMERRLNWVKDSHVLERYSEGFHGLRLKMGGLVTGGGFAVGPEFRREGLAGGLFDFRASAQATMRGFHKEDVQLTMPSLAGGKLQLDFYAVHHDYPSLQYYGSGPASNRSGRSDFKLEDTAVDATLAYRPFRHLLIGGTAGYLMNNIGPGEERRFTNAELQYSSVPGMQQQANFSRLSTFVQYDYRDNPGGPRAGGNYFAQFHSFGDRTLGLHDFRRLDLEAQQYIPFFNNRRVFALRAKTALTFKDANQTIPFYMQPTLGGTEDLRGYRPFRFRGDNMLVMNAEYRWEVFSGLDMAVFGDAGKVFDRKKDFDLSNLESSMGFGFRFNARNNVFMRLDFGFSHEGFQIAMKFNDLFRRGPTRTSSTQGDF